MIIFFQVVKVWELRKIARDLPQAQKGNSYKLKGGKTIKDRSLPPPQKNSLFRKKLLWILLSLVPVLFLITCVSLHHAHVPYWNLWELLPLIEEYHQENVSPYTLCRQHNEHRLVFPKFIILIPADLTHWNISFELAVNIVLAVGMFLLLALLIKRTAKTRTPPEKAWIFPIVSLLVFSLIQWEKWIWGWQIQIFLITLAFLGVVLLLTRPGLNGIGMASSILLGIIANFSFANGLFFSSCLLKEKRRAYGHFSKWQNCHAHPFIIFLASSSRVRCTVLINI